MLWIEFSLIKLTLGNRSLVHRIYMSLVFLMVYIQIKITKTLIRLIRHHQLDWESNILVHLIFFTKSYQPFPNGSCMELLSVLQHPICFYSLSRHNDPSLLLGRLTASEWDENVIEKNTMSCLNDCTLYGNLELSWRRIRPQCFLLLL